jgi:hypothetical protein
MIVLQTIRNWIAVVMRNRNFGLNDVNVSSGDRPISVGRSSAVDRRVQTKLLICGRFGDEKNESAFAALDRSHAGFGCVRRRKQKQRQRQQFEQLQQLEQHEQQFEQLRQLGQRQLGTGG